MFDKIDLDKLFIEYPSLTKDGFNDSYGDGIRKYGKHFEERNRRPTRKKVESYAWWIRDYMLPTSEITREGDSHLLAHIALNDTSGSFSHSEGAFIAAAILLGYRFNRKTEGGRSAVFNMTYKAGKKTNFTPDEIRSVLDKDRSLSAGGYDNDGQLELSGMVDCINRCAEWIQINMRPAKRINDRRSSYGLKHLAEREIGYIPQGVFIVAAILLGYQHVKIGINAHFNMSEKSIRVAERRLNQR